MRGIQTQIALSLLGQTQKRLERANRRLAIIRIMLDQFRKQAEGLPQTDPVRQVIEMFIVAIENAANGIVAGESDTPPGESILVAPPAAELKL